jgi:hypothetical protein
VADDAKSEFNDLIIDSKKPDFIIIDDRGINLILNHQTGDFKCFLLGRINCPVGKSL